MMTAGDTASTSQPQSSGVTLLDLILMISGGWAIPLSTEVALGPQTAWRVPAYIAGGVGGLFWAWYSKKFEAALQRALFSRDSATVAASTPSAGALACLYFGVLAASLLLQYGLYRVLRLLLPLAFGHRWAL